MSRAEPLPPDERRRAIVEAVIPLLMERGSVPTTREIATAAGVAEGTIFRVFEDKAELVRAAAGAALDPDVVERSLAAIDPNASLEFKLIGAARVLEERLEVVQSLGPVMRSLPISRETMARGRSFIVKSNSRIEVALSALVAPHSDILRMPPDKAAVAFARLISSTRFLGSEESTHLEVEDLVDLFLHGAAKPSKVGST